MSISDKKKRTGKDAAPTASAYAFSAMYYNTQLCSYYCHIAVLSCQ